jgi:hypothetical protein
MFKLVSLACLTFLTPQCDAQKCITYDKSFHTFIATWHNQDSYYMVGVTNEGIPELVKNGFRLDKQARKFYKESK